MACLPALCFANGGDLPKELTRESTVGRLDVLCARSADRLAGLADAALVRGDVRGAAFAVAGALSLAFLSPRLAPRRRRNRGRLCSQ